MGGLKCGIHLQIVEVNDGIRLTQVSLQKKNREINIPRVFSIIQGNDRNLLLQPLIQG